MLAVYHWEFGRTIISLLISGAYLSTISETFALCTSMTVAISKWSSTLIFAISALNLSRSILLIFRYLNDLRTVSGLLKLISNVTSMWSEMQGSETLAISGTDIDLETITISNVWPLEWVGRFTSWTRPQESIRALKRVMWQPFTFSIWRWKSPPMMIRSLAMLMLIKYS